MNPSSFSLSLTLKQILSHSLFCPHSLFNFFFRFLLFLRFYFLIQSFPYSCFMFSPFLFSFFPFFFLLSFSLFLFHLYFFLYLFSFSLTHLRFFFSFSFRKTVAPVCKSNLQSAYGVARNELVQVMCDLDSDPNNVTFRWFFNDFTDKTEIRTFTSNGSSSIASYVPSTVKTYGKMICFGENSIGRQKDPCIFNIIPAS